MKKLFLLLVLLISSFVYPQFVNVTESNPIKTTVVKRGGIFLGSLSVYQDHAVVSFNTVTNNVSTPQFTNLTFEELESFKTLILKTENKVEDVYKMESAAGNVLIVTYQKFLGKIHPIITLQINGISYNTSFLTSKQWKELFEVS